MTDAGWRPPFVAGAGGSERVPIDPRRPIARYSWALPCGRASGDRAPAGRAHSSGHAVRPAPAASRHETTSMIARTVLLSLALLAPARAACAVVPPPAASPVSTRDAQASRLL